MKTIRILIVEDDKKLLQTLEANYRSILESCDFQVTIEKAETVDAAEDKIYGDTTPYELPEHLDDAVKRRKAIEKAKAEFLFTSFTSDWLYTSAQSKDLYEMTQRLEKTSTYEEIDLPYGHDAFLLDGDKQAKVLTDFLTSQ